MELDGKPFISISHRLDMFFRIVIFLFLLPLGVIAPWLIVIFGLQSIGDDFRMFVLVVLYLVFFGLAFHELIFILRKGNIFLSLFCVVAFLSGLAAFWLPFFSSH